MIQPASDISVIICAYSEARWNDLVEAVESVQQQTLPPLEIILSIDHNSALVERVRTSLTGVVVTENKEVRGLSGARNSGIAIAKGRKIAFLDDDAIAEPEWLACLDRWFDNPQVLGSGGKADPIWQGTRPTWFPDEFDWVVGCSYRGMPQVATPIRNLFGGNMCIRREIFDNLGGFRSGIGRVGAVPYGCEETEFCIRAGQQYPQGIFIYDPEVAIRHKVPVSRTQWRYFYSRCYAEGLSKALVSQVVGSRDGLSSERGYVWRTLPRGVVRNFGDVFRRNDWAGLARAWAITTGLAVTTIGYLRGIVSRQFSRTN